jgi:Phospholipase_D-nuclease N-terminal
VPDLIALLPLLLPLVVIQLILLALAIYDLFKEERRVRWFSKPVWACIIVFVNVIGPLAYFFVGREDV